MTSDHYCLFYLPLALPSSLLHSQPSAPMWFSLSQGTVLPICLSSFRLACSSPHGHLVHLVASCGSFPICHRLSAAVVKPQLKLQRLLLIFPCPLPLFTLFFPLVLSTIWGTHPLHTCLLFVYSTRVEIFDDLVHCCIPVPGTQ